MNVPERTDEAFLRERKAVYGLISDDLYVPMRAKEIAVVLQVPQEKRNELHRVLDSLVADGKITLTKRGRYLKREMKLFEGTFEANTRGFGFVRVEGFDEDFYIPRDYTMGAFQGDIVQIAPLGEGHSEHHRTEAKIIRIVSHQITQIVGTFDSVSGYGFVIPDDSKIHADIFVPVNHTMGAGSGDKVVVELTSYGSGHSSPEGQITEVIGEKDEAGVDITSLVRAYNIPSEFPGEVLDEADRVAQPVSESDIAGRADYRGLLMITIDGEDAKDLDDAVSLSKTADGYLLGVHIADVSHYVAEGSRLDQEAIRRGTSVYLADRVIPMLPVALSNGMCSLNEGKDRLALSCMMKMDPSGRVVDHKITESVIRTTHRMNYPDVQAILEGDTELGCRYADVRDMLFLMKELSDKIRARRTARGAIDFDLPETDIELDENGHPVGLSIHPRNAATMLIEDFMLSANETVAEEFESRGIPFLYRTHETPEADKMRSLKTFVGSLGYVLRGDPTDMNPLELQRLISDVEGSPEEEMIDTIVLRSMKQARYTVENTGHFGLAAKYYCHYTSPIRRYPDLQIHRIIKEVLHGTFNAARQSHYESILPVIAVQTSKLERRADEIERDVDKLKKVQYMENHIGEIFEGTISSVTSWGFYVQLENTVEGLVAMTSLHDDYYEYSEETYELIGRRHNRHFHLGQRVLVRCTACDRSLGTIDFELEERSNGRQEEH